MTIPSEFLSSLMEQTKAKRPTRIYRFSPADDEIIRRDYFNYVPTAITAVKLNRSHGTLRQRILALGLHRENVVSRYLNFAWVPEHLKAQRVALGNDAFVAACRQWKKQQVLNAADERVEYLEQGRTLAAEIYERADLDRMQKIRMMYENDGVTLDFIGQKFGITRERVRQLLAKPEGPTPQQRRELRNQQIVEEFNRGMVLEAIALKHDVTSNTVRLVCKLAGVYPRERMPKVEVPIETAGQQKRRARNQLIREDFNSGMSFEDLADKYNLVPSYVRLICTSVK